MFCPSRSHDRRGKLNQCYSAPFLGPFSLLWGGVEAKSAKHIKQFLAAILIRFANVRFTSLNAPLEHVDIVL